MLIAGMVFTSCKKDDDEPQDLKPSIAFKTSGDYISSDVTINQGESILVGVLCSSNQNSGKKLTNFKIYMIINNVTQPAMVDSSGFSESVFEANYTITFPDVLDGKLYAEITDKDGQKNSLSFNVTVEEDVTPLGVPEDLTWQRVGSAAATGLDMFGLEWTSNGKEVNAQITKAVGGAEKFVLLIPDEWTSIETVEDLAAAVEAGEDMDVYEGISAETSSTYDEVLATKFNDEYFIIHLENATIEVNLSGTTITITGKYKK
ncbi:MAG: hypothetical protein ISS18_10275 [Bacteroidales bacterium]|nr:hypothetical protein [Bacteroidales bacterium]